jgi:hypothetical protein
MYGEYCVSTGLIATVTGTGQRCGALARGSSVAEVLVEVTDITSGIRQIGPREKKFVNIEDRRHELQQAITAGINIADEAVSKASIKGGWHVSELSMKFAITLTAEASIIVSSTSGEASFEVNVTLTRGSNQ